MCRLLTSSSSLTMYLRSLTWLRRFRRLATWDVSSRASMEVASEEQERKERECVCVCVFVKKKKSARVG